MGVRLFFGVILAVLMPGLAQAADCITVRQGDVAIVQEARCGDLKLMSRKRDDSRPNIDIAATWIEFTLPSSPGEWRYNEWVRRQIATLNFDRPIQLAPDHKSEDRFALDSFYRSDRLISVRYARRICCGGHDDSREKLSANTHGGTMIGENAGLLAR